MYNHASSVRMKIVYYLDCNIHDRPSRFTALNRLVASKHHWPVSFCLSYYLTHQLFSYRTLHLYMVSVIGQRIYDAAPLLSAFHIPSILSYHSPASPMAMEESCFFRLMSSPIYWDIPRFPSLPQVSPPPSTPIHPILPALASSVAIDHGALLSTSFSTFSSRCSLRSEMGASEADHRAFVHSREAEVTRRHPNHQK